VFASKNFWQLGQTWCRSVNTWSTLGQHLVKTWLRCGLVHEYARE
jgi:hypothetical protein